MAKDVKAQAAKYLADHTLVDKVYGTSDGFLFETKQHAIQHGATLDDKKVTTFAREADVADETLEDKPAKTTGKGKKDAGSESSK